MKEKYLMPAIRVANYATGNLMLSTSDKEADPDEPVLGKEMEDEEFPTSNSVWED